MKYLIVALIVIIYITFFSLYIGKLERPESKETAESMELDGPQRGRRAHPTGVA